jgi:branched-chain amino acid transport system ATP-binding protein
MPKPILEVSSLTVCYGAYTALKGVNIRAYENELVALVGPNGAGKTTLLESIAGLKRPKEGEVKIFDTELDGLSSMGRRKLGLLLVPQEGNIFSFMSVKENLEVSAFLVRDKKEREEALETVYQIFPILRARKSQSAGTLSGGEQKMLAIGMGIASNARLLMVDELSIGLAPKVVGNILSILKKIKEETSKTIILSEQSIKVLEVADRVFGLEAGEIRFAEKTKNLNGDIIKSLYLGG